MKINLSIIISVSIFWANLFAQQILLPDEIFNQTSIRGVSATRYVFCSIQPGEYLIQLQPTHPFS